jgi:hypothetical protein
MILPLVSLKILPWPPKDLGGYAFASEELCSAAIIGHYENLNAGTIYKRLWKIPLFERWSS